MLFRSCGGIKGDSDSACCFNKTSFFRGLDEPVPAVERLRKDSDANPSSLEDLKKFGETLQTGDILIMHCTHTFGKLAQLATNSVWDHVAMVVRLDDTDDTVAERIALVKEAPPPTTRTVPEWPLPGEAGPVEVFEAMGCGVYSYPLMDHAICRGKFIKYAAVRRLRNAEGEPLGAEARAKIENFLQEFWGRPFENYDFQGFSELARPILRLRHSLNIEKVRNKDLENLDNLFCSELIAEAYQSAGLLPEKTLNSNEVVPGMFGLGETVDKYLAKEDHGFKLDEPEVYKAPRTPLASAIQTIRDERLAPKERHN